MTDPGIVDLLVDNPPQEALDVIQKLNKSRTAMTHKDLLKVYKECMKTYETTYNITNDILRKARRFDGMNTYQKMALMLRSISAHSDSVPKGKVIPVDTDRMADVDFLYIFSLNNPWEDMAAEFAKEFTIETRAQNLSPSEMFYGFRPEDKIIPVLNNELHAIFLAKRLGTAAWKIGPDKFFISGVTLMVALSPIIPPIEVFKPGSEDDLDQYSILNRLFENQEYLSHSVYTK